jgi:hypothetical protein
MVARFRRSDAALFERIATSRRPTGQKEEPCWAETAARTRTKGRWIGRREAGGALTGDNKKKSEGRSDQRKGRAKEKKGNLKDLLS